MESCATPVISDSSTWMRSRSFLMRLRLEQKQVERTFESQAHVGPSAEQDHHADHNRQLATANKCHSSGIPFKLCVPRSSNWSPDPTTRSLTVLETSTSPGIAFASTRAPICTATPPMSSPSNSHSPVCRPILISSPRCRNSSRIRIAQRMARTS